MKIIARDNFDREVIAQRLIATDVEPELAKRLVESLNDAFASDDDDEWWYAAVADDYRLWRGMEDLV